MVTITVKVGPKYQVVIPEKLRAAVKLKVGDLLKAELRGDSILLTCMSRLEGDLAAAEADVEAGRVYGPFSSAKAALRSLHREAKKAIPTSSRRPGPVRSNPAHHHPVRRVSSMPAPARTSDRASSANTRS